MAEAHRRRIAILTTGHPPLDGRIFHKQAKSLAAAGYEVVYIAPESTEARQHIEAARLRFVSLGTGSGWRRRIERCLMVARILWRQRHEFEVWHVHDPELLVLCAPLRLLTNRRVRLVYDVHEDYAAAVRTREWLPSWSRGTVSVVTRVVEALLSRTSQLIVAATPGIAKRFPEGGGRSVVTVHNYPVVSGYDSAGHRRPAPTRCVYAGWLTAQRGAAEMVAALTELVDEPIELVLAGAFEPVELRDEVLSGAPENVEYVGQLPWEDVPGLLSSAHIGLLCLHPTPNHLASLPTKLFEYLDAGLAVVASDFPAWRTYVADQGVGLQVDPHDPLAIAAAIRELSNDPVRREQMGQRGRELARRYTWEAEAGVLLAAYAALLDPSAA